MTTLLAVPGNWIPRAHTAIASTAFLIALGVGWFSGLWTELCINGVAGWPVEWFPSVSATIGDHPPPRAPFQILIALCATPRFLLLLLQWLVHRNHSSSFNASALKDLMPSTTIHARGQAEAGSARNDGPTSNSQTINEVETAFEEAVEDVLGPKRSGKSADLEVIVGIIRTFCCGGWVYITSRDHHDIHDLFMILYLLLTPPWMYLSTRNSTSLTSKRNRRILFAGFMATIPPLIWMYYRHSVMRIPGAYTYYSMLEWSLVGWDVAFDSVATMELGNIQLRIVNVASPTDGQTGTFSVGNGISHENDLFLAPRSSRKQKSSVTLEGDWTSLNSDDVIFHGRVAIAWISDVFLSCCFWTVFTSLGVQLFYWSVWKLALAGSELALLANLSAYTLASVNVRQSITSRQGLITQRIIMVVAGIGCYILPTPALRLVGVSLGTWTGWLAFLGNWARLNGSPEMLAEGKTLLMGLILTLLLKYVNYSTNPFWCITSSDSGGWNKTGLILAGICLLEYAYRPPNLHPTSLLTPQTSKKDVKPLIKPTKVQQYIIAVGLGGLIHLIQTLLTDSGTIISWTWTGYPISGPTLHPFGPVIIGISALSLAITDFIPVFSISFSGFGLLSTATLYLYQDWVGFIGGIGVTIYLSAIFPHYLRVATACSPSRVFGTAMFVNIILDVASVITAAYAFVPFGYLLRERTDLVIVFAIGAVVLGSTVAQFLELPDEGRVKVRARVRLDWVKKWTLISAVVMSSLALAVGWMNMPVEKPRPYYPNHRMFSGGIWTVHFGVDEGGRDSQRRMMELIRDMEVDVLGLLETDLHRFVYGNRDLTRVIAEELGYYVDLGPGPNKHTWGAALLSKFPIINSTHHLLPSPHGELAPAIHATLDIHGTRVDVMVSHNGQEEDALDRELQTTEIARLLRETGETPSVFLGYLVTHPGDQRPWPYQILMEDGHMYDIELSDRWRWCEYIAFRGLWRIAFSRIHEADISDTELQVGKFLLPLPGTEVVYESDKEMYWHIGENDVPSVWHMPAKFRGNGTRGHVYRVWDGPLYYLPPERSGLQKMV